MKNKFQLQFMGLDERGWRTISYHASVSATYRRLRKNTAHLASGTWDGYHRAITPDGKVLTRSELHLESVLSKRIPA